MDDILASTWFRYLLFPLGSAMIGVALKWVSRNDQYAKFQKEDMAIGLELMLSATLMFIVLTSDRAIELVKSANKLEAALAASPVDQALAQSLQQENVELTTKFASSGWVIAAMALGLWSVSTIVRKWGWNTSTQMRPIVGIGLPMAVGVLSLLVVIAGASS